MDEPEAEPVLALLDPLLRAFEMLAFVARHLHPPDFAELMSRFSIRATLFARFFVRPEPIP